MSPGAPDAYAALGFGHRQGFGRRPALVIVDFCYGFTDPASPLACSCDDALMTTAALLRAFRAAGLPVVYTSVVYDDASVRTAVAFLAKAPALNVLRRGTRWPLIDQRIAPRGDEPVLEKLFASAFFGTGLESLLTVEGCDSVVVCGASTSGCVRATVVDALQYGYRVTVPRDAVADRLASAHEGSLRDIDAKYGDVVDAEEIIAWLA